MTKKSSKSKQSSLQSDGGNKKTGPCRINKCKMSFRIIFLSALVGGAFYIYTKVNEIPPLPEVDANRWWGPNERKGKLDDKIKPFKVEFSDIMINDLKERLMHRRPMTPPLENIGFQYGFNTKYLDQVIEYWMNKYDFKQRESNMNKFPHFTTYIQGLNIHFMHIKPSVKPNVKVLPILLLHGWPGSFVEFLEAIPKLTQVNQYGFAFEVIIPSLPGYGFSEGAVRPGMSALEMAVTMNNLMQRLGHKKYYIQGGDWGALICKNIALLYPDNILGHHSNMLATFATSATMKLWLGSLFPTLIEPNYPELVYPILEKYSFIAEETGYFHIQSTKPDTIGAALSDTPLGLAAYILEKFSTWTNPDFRKAYDGNLTKKISLDRLLDNIMIYWSTNSITTSMRLYSETFNKAYLGMNLDAIPTEVPTWALKAKYELAILPDTILRPTFINLLGTSWPQDGGHFFAFELPDVYANDVIKAVDTFEKFNHAKAMPKSDL